MIAAIIQARMGSSRLPGKTLADIYGKPLLAHVIERIRPSRWVEQIVVATTNRRKDEKLLDLYRYRWTIDYPVDLSFAREIYRRLYRGLDAR